MNAFSTSLPQFRDLYERESADLRQTFERTGDGSAAIRRRASIVDTVVRKIWTSLVGAAERSTISPSSPPEASAAANSSLTLTSMCSTSAPTNPSNATSIRQSAPSPRPCGTPASAPAPPRAPSRNATRSIPHNLEFTVSLLDRRFLAGDTALYSRLETELLPVLALRDWDVIVQNLAEMARSRHAKYGNTIFHLEPNIKECPGGLRDYHLAQWLTLLTSPAGAQRPGRSPTATTSTEPTASASTPSTSSPPPDVSSTTVISATTTPLTGTRRTKPPRSASASKPAAPPTPPTGCAPTTARRAPSTAAPRYSSIPSRRPAAPSINNSAASARLFPEPTSSSSRAASSSPRRATGIDGDAILQHLRHHRHPRLQAQPGR